MASLGGDSALDSRHGCPPFRRLEVGQQLLDALLVRRRDERVLAQLPFSFRMLLREDVRKICLLHLKQWQNCLERKT